MRALIEIDQAISVVQQEMRSRASHPGAIVMLDEAVGRVLARDVISPIDSPPFDKSTRDGFALSAGGSGTEWIIRDTVAAGGAPGRALAPGECSRIMTGAPLPSGAERVASKECMSERNGRARLLKVEPLDNIVRRGANIARGQVVLHPKVLAAQDIGILAASGFAEVTVAVPLSIGIVCTGPELQPPGGPLGAGQIYDSNGPQLAAQLAAIQCPARQRGIVADEPGLLTEALASALAEHELVLVSGGVSEGDFDYVPGCLESLGATILMHGVAVKPGKPTLFARRGSSWIFGLPGNPVSTFVIFELLVKPFLYGCMGIDWEPPCFHGTLGEVVRRKDAGRVEYLPVRMQGGSILPIAFHGSAHLNALGDADGIIRIERGVHELARGTEIDVRPL